jgi:hypothetical protein
VLYVIYAQCRVFDIVMLSIIMLNVVMLCVVAPDIKIYFSIAEVILMIILAGNTNSRGSLSMADLLIKVACFVSKIFIFSKSKRADQY